MLTLTPNPKTVELRLQDWDSVQPNSKTGDGTRSEIVCTLEYSSGSVGVTYLRTEFYQRDTPTTPWKLTYTTVERENSFTSHLMLAAAVQAIIYHLNPHLKPWPGPESAL